MASYLEQDVLALVDLIESTFDEETNTFNQEDVSVIKELAEEEINPTLERYAKAMQFYNDSARALADEIKRLQARKKHFENGADHIKSRLNFSMRALNKGHAYTTLNYTFSFRKSSSVKVIDNIDYHKLPDYLVRVSYEVDKTAVKELEAVDGKVLDKDGNVIDGITIEQKESLSVR